MPDWNCLWLNTFAIASVYTIYEGTSEIQQLVIARSISGMRVE